MDEYMPGDTLNNPSQCTVSQNPCREVPAKVLVVDDSRVARAYLELHLSKAGYAVTVAKDGKEALAVLSENTSVVLLDLLMPEMDGMACLRHIREQHPDIPVIIITVSHEIAHAVDAMKNGAYYYVTKPFNPDEILALVEQAVRARSQTKKLHIIEGQLNKVHALETSVAAQIRKSLLVTGLPGELHGIKAGGLNVASKDIDGDFYDCFAVGSNCIDLIVGDVMGKGVPAALLGAEIKKHFMNVLYKLTRPSGTTSHPSPEKIVSTVHKEMIRRLREEETFFTLGYARFDMHRHLLSYVDCGHMRPIHFHHETNTCTLLQGVNMPIGFPLQDTFKQILVPFTPGDLFLFYSDGITEATDAKGAAYGEDRLMKFIRRNAHLEPRDLCDTIYKEVASYSRTESFTDDITCVAMKVDLTKPEEQSRPQWHLKIKSTLNELDRVRGFIVEVCRGLGKTMVDGERIKMIQIVATEITTNIIKHAYAGKKGKDILIEATTSPDEIMFNFYDWGVEFDFSTAPTPVFDGSREDGFGLHIIAHTADYVRYWRDEDGRNTACVTFFLNKRG